MGGNGRVKRRQKWHAAQVCRCPELPGEKDKCDRTKIAGAGIIGRRKCTPVQVYRHSDSRKEGGGRVHKER